MLVKPSFRLAASKADLGKLIKVRDVLRCLIKPLYAEKQMKLPSREFCHAIHDKEETVREICEMMRWSIFHR